MSDSDESNFGALLFGDETDQAPVEYPIETLLVDRVANVSEGTTNDNYATMYHCFDSLDVTTAVVTGRDVAAESAEPIKTQLAMLTARLTRLAPEPIAVHYRNKHHSLWGHRLWNAAKYLSKRMDQRCIDVRGKTVLELGAGLGVPSIVAYRNGAKVVVVTDYPDEDLLDVIQLNVDENCKPALVDADVRGDATEKTTGKEAVAVVEPLLWGKGEHVKKVMTYTGGQGFDIVILSDILFNHVCNDDLVDTLLRTLSHSRTAAGYCVFSHHRAYKQLQDFEFFDKCVAHGLVYEQVDEEAYPMMFPEDRGPEEVRMPVKCYKITRRYDRVGAPIDLPSIFANYALMDKAKNDGKSSERGKPQFDVLVQGTGLTQSLLSAALARSGLKVLHCDGEGQYGGAHATLNLAQFTAYLKRMEVTAAEEATRKAVGAQVAHLYARPHVPGTESPRIHVDKTSECAERSMRFFIDVLPVSYMANGDLVQQLVRSDMVRTMEFQHLSGFLFIEPTGALSQVPLTRSAIFSTTEVGLLEKRRLMKFVKDVEASLVEQFHAKSASPADSKVLQEEAAAAAAAEAATAFAKELEGQPDLTLSQLLASKYNLSGRALDIITLMGQLDCVAAKASKREGGETDNSEPGLLRSVQLVRQLLTSIGAYGGSTPLLVPSYGASELPQNMCRTSAVWGTVFVLQRSLTRLYIDADKEVQYAVLSNGQHVPARVVVAPQELVASATTPNSNGCHQSCRKRALPVRLAGWKPVLELERRRAAGTLNEGVSTDDLFTLKTNGEDVQLSRVVVIARRPLITSAALKLTNGDVTSSNENSNREEEDAPAIVIALMHADSDDKSSGPVVHLVQQSAASEQVLPRTSQHVILHFTAKADELPQDALETFVRQRFLLSGGDRTTTAVADGISLSMDADVVLFAGFTLSSLQVALDSIYGDSDTNNNDKGEEEDGVRAPQPLLVDIPSATRDSHAFAVGECEKLQQATENNRRRVLHEDEQIKASQAGKSTAGTEAEAEEVDSPFLRLVGVPTIPSASLLNDGQYMAAAKRAYEQVVEHLVGGPEGLSEAERKEQFIFLEKLPPLPPPATAAAPAT